NNFSSRRTVFELQMAFALGYINKIPHFNSINNYLNNPGIGKYLVELYILLASPMIPLENNFAVDATGFSTLNKNRWMDLRFDRRGSVKDYKKLHIIIGVRTNIITSARVTKATVSDTKCFPELVKKTSLNFRIREVCADAGYLSRKNCSLVKRIGADPYIMPRIDTRARAGRSSAWHRMIRMWEDNRELFAQHYHQRSTVESTFSAMKRKFLSFVRSKTDLAIENEILCKVVCYNGSVLVNAIFELDIDLDFSR
ncbi:MAG: transposase, partial [Candidatus Aenigmatarchaeota archaeon]